jgi:ABC-2 type transport system ATP-binding protein
MSYVAPLQVTGLTRRFGDVTAIEHLSLEVRTGEILGFLGPNGAGKTTTLRVCAGLLPPDAGEVRVDGVSLAAEPLRARARMGLVPDRPFLYDRLTAREFLDFVAALYELPAEEADGRAEMLLARLDLGDAVDDLIETYSHGTRQKVAIAAALLHRPRLVMLDEPLTGLDPRASRTLKDLLREHADQGGGVLVSTHLLEVAERLCDRVAILHRGRVVAEGSLSDLRGARHDATLEDVFLELTADATASPDAH